jgi:hypothetical protein
MNGRREFTITKLRLDDDGVWRARVTVDGTGVDVDRLYGSWRVPADPKHGLPERQVHTYIAIELAAKVRAIENARGPRKKDPAEELESGRVLESARPGVPDQQLPHEDPTDQPRALIG